jgi:hypothetical protein
MAISAGPAPQTLVWETASDVAVTADNEFIFNFIQNFGGAHFLGAFVFPPQRMRAASLRWIGQTAAT